MGEGLIHGYMEKRYGFMVVVIAVVVTVVVKWFLWSDCC